MTVPNIGPGATTEPPRPGQGIGTLPGRTSRTMFDSPIATGDLGFPRPGFVPLGTPGIDNNDQNGAGVNEDLGDKSPNGDKSGDGNAGTSPTGEGSQGHIGDKIMQLWFEGFNGKEGGMSPSGQPSTDTDSKEKTSDNGEGSQANANDGGLGVGNQPNSSRPNVIFSGVGSQVINIGPRHSYWQVLVVVIPYIL